jgi:hypothetical protein
MPAGLERLLARRHEPYLVEPQGIRRTGRDHQMAPVNWIE